MVIVEKRLITEELRRSVVKGIERRITQDKVKSRRRTKAED